MTNNDGEILLGMEAPLSGAGEGSVFRILYVMELQRWFSKSVWKW
jgi:hypothetical protein